VIEVADPTATDAYLQFVGNLQQLGALAVAIIGAGIIAAEVRSGTAALTLAKPLSRTGYVLTKAGTLAALTVVSTLAGAAVCIAVTAAIFGAGPVADMLAAAGCWLLTALLLVAATALLSAAVRSQMAAAVGGVAIVIALGVLGQVGVVRDSTPAGLVAAGSRLLAGEPVALLTPIATAIVLTAILLVAAVAVFRRREI
jgi:ABC-2 type transport system permease protein